MVRDVHDELADRIASFNELLDAGLAKAPRFYDLPLTEQTTILRALDHMQEALDLMLYGAGNAQVN